MFRRSRLPLILLAFASLVFGLWTGLSRMGWGLRLPEASLHHGAIMVGGFLGTLISLEKVIPLRYKMLFAVPLASGCSIIAFLSGTPALSLILLIGASTALTLVFSFYLFREKNLIYLLMVAGSVCWLTGNLLLLSTNFYPMSFPWWLAFALLIITAERLELMKFLPVSKIHKRFLLIFLAIYVCGILLSFHGPGSLLSGISLIAVSVWLLRFDIIGISIHKEGLPKFVAISLSAGYVAMLLTGVLFLALREHAMAYDATVHTFFLGFVFSMIFAHGPIILPGVLGISAKPYHRILYAWLLLLHASWMLRIAADVILQFQLRQLTGIVSAVAILGYFASLAMLTIKQVHRNEKALL